MERIKDGRRNILIHGNADEDDLPVDGLPELPKIPNGGSFTPRNMDEPTLYSGDVIVGVYDDEIEFGELIYDRVDGGVIVVTLNDGVYRLHKDAEFNKRFYNADEIHVFDGVADELVDWDVEFDESKLTRPDTTRPR